MIMDHYKESTFVIKIIIFSVLIGSNLPAAEASSLIKTIHVDGVW